MKGWTDTVALANFPVFLKAKALRVWTSCNDKDTLDKAYKAIIDGCKPPNESLLVDFLSRKMKPNESISRYALDLQQLLQIAAPELQVAYQSAFLRAHLCLSLPKELQNLVNFTADALSWDQLLVKLDQMDTKSRCMPAQYGTGHTSLPGNALNTLIKNEPIDTFAADTRHTSLPIYQQNQQRNDNQQRNFCSQQKLPFKGKCHYCKAVGHMQQDCRKLANRNNNEGRQGISTPRERNNHHASTYMTEASPSVRFSDPAFPFCLDNNHLDVCVNQLSSVQ